MISSDTNISEHPARNAQADQNDGNNETGTQERPLSTWAAGASAAAASIALVVSILSYLNSADQARTARETLRISQRAYVGTPDADIYALPNNQGMMIRANIVNYGNTPAYALSVRQDYKILDNGSEEKMFPIKGKETISRQTLQPKSPLQSKGSPIPQSFIDEIRGLSGNGDRKLFFAMQVEYKDAFGSRHISQYCYEARKAIGDGVWHPEGIKGVMATCPTHNCSDDDCTGQ